MEVATSTQPTVRGLFTVGPDMAELLAVIALFETCPGSVYLILDNDLAEAGQFEDFHELLIRGKHHQK